MFAVLLACTGAGPADTGGSGPVDSGDTAGDSGDTAGDTGDTGDTGDVVPVVYDPWPFADTVVDHTFGEAAGYGQDRFPDVVYGPPESSGAGGGGLDVLSLGDQGSIVLAFRARDVVDGPGVDLLVFENPLVGWVETGVVGVSDDGVSWVEWPCDTADADGGYPGCAGVALVYTNSTNGIDATDPDAAGGDRYDLADIGVGRARYVRIRDSGANSYAGNSGGFDLDAVAILNGAPWE